MGRIPRKKLDTCYYHVMVQGLNKCHLFKDDKFKKTYRTILKNYLPSSGVLLLAYCIMGNHVHLLIYTEDVKFLSNFMQRVNGSFAMIYNVAKGRVGYVFRDRFKTQEIESKRQLLTCFRYIHFNPVKGKFVEKPEQYEFSSFNEYKLGNFKYVNKEAIEKVFAVDHTKSLRQQYIEQFIQLHDFTGAEKKVMMPEEEEQLEKDEIYLYKCMNEISKRHSMEFNELINVDKVLSEFVTKIRKNTSYSYEFISEILGITKYKIVKAVKNYDNFFKI